jgi:hypothetical protein
MGAFRTFRTGVLPQITNVRLYDETIDHVKAQHPEVPAHLPSMILAVENTLINPTHNEKSRSNSYVYVDDQTTNASGDPFRIPVKVIDATSALVRTFFFASTRVSTEAIVWRRDENGG